MLALTFAPRIDSIGRHRYENSPKRSWPPDGIEILRFYSAQTRKDSCNVLFYTVYWPQITTTTIIRINMFRNPINIAECRFNSIRFDSNWMQDSIWFIRERGTRTHGTGKRAGARKTAKRTELSVASKKKNKSLARGREREGNSIYLYIGEGYFILRRLAPRRRRNVQPTLLIMKVLSEQFFG